MALVFQYLDPATYDLEARAKELGELYNPTGFDPSVILVSGALGLPNYPWAVPATLDLLNMVQDYIGGPTWDSNKNPTLYDTRYRKGWNQVWTVETQKLAKKISEYGFIYPYMNAPDSFIYPAIKNSNSANNPLTDLFSGFAISDIVMQSHEIGLSLSGQNISEAKYSKDSVDSLQQYIEQRFDKRYTYKVSASKSNTVGVHYVDLSSFNLRFVNGLEIKA